MKPDLIKRLIKAINRTPKTFPFSLLLAGGLFLTACGDRAKVSDSTDPTGVYTLATVNGLKLPATVSHDGAKLEVRSGSFTISADGTCSSRIVFVPPSGAESTRDVNATYTRDGSKLTMKWTGAGMTTGTVTGDTFTMTNEGMIFSYRKQAG